MDEKGRKQAELDEQALLNLLEPDDILLNYMFMDRDIILFVLTKNRHSVFVLPFDSKKFDSLAINIIRGLSDPSSDQTILHNNLLLLSNEVLGPIREIIGQKKRVVVLSDSKLNVIPFDILSLDEHLYRPIIKEKVVINAPSLKYILQAKKENKTATGFFAMADPKFSSSPEFETISTAELRGIDPSRKYMSYFSRLPDTRTEVQSIASMYKGEHVETLYGDEAKKSYLLKADLKSFGYLHFATHGILGGDIPGVDEPALVLAEEKEADAFLRASEAEKLQLNAELTVLSACNTGTGKYFTGEGVMGISRSFLLAGSRSVVVSLWSVPSKETEELMVKFYKYKRSGMESSEALRKAKLEIMKQLSTNTKSGGERGLKIKATLGENQIQSAHPFFWAPFILYGGI